MVRVKVCGNRSPEDIEMGREADVLGFVVGSPDAPRNLTLLEAKNLMRLVPPFVQRAAVTREETLLGLAHLAKELRPDILQVHAGVSPTVYTRLMEVIPGGTKIIGLLPLPPAGVSQDPEGAVLVLEVAKVLRRSGIDAIVLDTITADRTSGGTGIAHDWSLARMVRDSLQPFPVILAGGLNPENVTEAIQRVRPYGVDAASGLERNGKKDAYLVGKFVATARGAPQ